MEIEIGTVAEEKGRHIAETIANKYGTDPIIVHKSFFASFLDGLLNGGLSHLKVEKEIYERSLHEATSFFLNHRDAKFDDKIIYYLRERLRTRLENLKVVKKMNPEEMLAHLIKIEVIDILLLEHDIVI